MKTETQPAPERVSLWVHFFRILAMHRTGYSAKFTEMAIAEAPDTFTNMLAQSLSMVQMPAGGSMNLSPLAAEWIEDNAI